MVLTALAMAATSLMFGFGVCLIATGELVDILFGFVWLLLAMEIYWDFGKWVTKRFDQSDMV